MMEKLNRKGINFIFHGHTHTNLDQSVVSSGGVHVIGVDHSCGKEEPQKSAKFMTT